MNPNDNRSHINEAYLNQYNKSIMRTAQLRRRRQRHRLALIGSIAFLILIGFALFLIFRTDRSVESNVPYNPELYEQTAATNEPEATTVLSPLETTAEPEERRFTVVVDPGHGYDDPGTGEGLLGDLTEKHITLSISLMLRDFLIQKGYDVIMTRENDQKPAGTENEIYLFNPAARVAFTQALDHYSLYVSVHIDAFPSDSSVRGTRIYYYKDGHANADKFASLLADSIQFKTETDKKPMAVAKDYDGAYRVIRDIVEVPSALIEIGFVTNEQDRANMLDQSWQEKMAAGIAEAVALYADEYSGNE